jgi:N-acetyl sugar amidotransferase
MMQVAADRLNANDQTKEVSSSGYRICKRCVMDSSDPELKLSGDGTCNHCRSFHAVMDTDPLRDPAVRRSELERIVARIRHDGRGRRYDCVVGVSGGVDSTYVALQVVKLGLRPLAVHLDNGWNSEIAVGNIERALRTLKIDLVTEVLDWDEFRDLQVAFLRASTPDSEIPTDHAILASVFHTAWRMSVPHLVMGHNRATELILPPAWSQGHSDWRYVSSIQKRFGTRSLKSFPHLDTVDYARYRLWARNRVFNILDYLDYTRDGAIATLQKEVGWRDYGGKHYESIYTRFFQGYILPAKFGFDKRRAHLSNKICAGQMTREAALEELRQDPYASEDLKREDRTFVLKKLGLSERDFDAIMRAPAKRYVDYPNMYNSAWYGALRSAWRGLNRRASS